MAWASGLWMPVLWVPVPVAVLGGPSFPGGVRSVFFAVDVCSRGALLWFVTEEGDPDFMGFLCLPLHSEAPVRWFPPQIRQEGEHSWFVGPPEAVSTCSPQSSHLCVAG